VSADATMLRPMRVSEWIAGGYFVFVAAASWRRQPVAAIAALFMAAIVALASRHAPPFVRDCMPLFYILGGYYLCAALFVAPSESIEAWLAAWDRRLLGDPSTRFAGWPRIVLAYLEVVYVGCFLLVPAGVALLAAIGRSALADRYWTIVMTAEFGSFAPLAFVQTRPPWKLERPAALRDRAIHRAGSRFVRQFTIGVNTFPSGHAAGSLAVALGVMDAMPIAGALLFALALTICLAAIVGRYHYTIDIIAGGLLALAIWIAVISFGFPYA
jgi:membrane-associated phospholipid phosphatase